LDKQSPLTHDNEAQASEHGHPFYLKGRMVFFIKKINNTSSTDKLFRHLKRVEGQVQGRSQGWQAGAGPYKIF